MEKTIITKDFKDKTGGLNIIRIDKNYNIYRIPIDEFVNKVNRNKDKKLPNAGYLCSDDLFLMDRASNEIKLECIIDLKKTENKFATLFFVNFGKVYKMHNESLYKIPVMGDSGKIEEKDVLNIFDFLKASHTPGKEVVSILPFSNDPQNKNEKNIILVTSIYGNTKRMDASIIRDMAYEKNNGKMILWPYSTDELHYAKFTDGDSFIIMTIASTVKGNRYIKIHESKIKSHKSCYGVGMRIPKIPNLPLWQATRIR